MHKTRFARVGALALASALTLLLGGARGAPTDADLNALFADLSPTAPGCAAGAEEGGRRLFAKAWGAADLTEGRPLTPTSRFYMASVSKQVAALTVLELVRSGRMRLDAPITTYIPELPPYLQTVTLYDLLTHTSGVRDYFNLASLSGTPDDHVFTEADVIAAVSRQEALNFPRGTAFLYSNSGYVLLAIAAERVRGQSFNAIAREELFGPLGMKDTFFQHHHEAPVPEKAHGYALKDGAWRLADSSLDVVGDGGLYSNVPDMLKWLENLDTGTAGAASLKEMETPAKTLDGKLTGYGMGLEFGTLNGVKIVEHGGALAGYRTADFWVPSERFGAVVLCNFAAADPSALARRIAALYLPALAEAPAPTAAAPPASLLLSPADLAAYAGVYVGSNGLMAKIALDHGRLVAANFDAPLTPTAPGVFALGAPTSGRALVFSKESPPQSVDLLVNGVSRMHLKRAAETVPAATRAAIVGDYASQDVPALYHITSAGAGLRLAIGEGAATVLDPEGDDRFLAEGLGAELVLKKGPDGAVTGFTVNGGRARGIVFHRA